MFKKTLLGAVILMVVLVSGLSAEESIYNNEGKLTYSNLYKNKFYLKIFEQNDGSKNYFMMQYIPFYSEYDSFENSNSYNWCGYAVMKSAVKGVLNKYASLSTFAYASQNAGYTTSFSDDIYIHHLYYISYDKVSFSGSYIKNHLVFDNTSINSSSKLLSSVIDTTLNNKGALIIPYSIYNGYPGHFYTIVGIKVNVDTNGNKEYYYLLRDVARNYAKSQFFDDIIEVEYFYSEAMGNSNNYSLKPIIKVLP